MAGGIRGISAKRMLASFFPILLFGSELLRQRRIRLWRL